MKNSQEMLDLIDVCMTWDPLQDSQELLHLVEKTKTAQTFFSENPYPASSLHGIIDDLSLIHI